MIKWFEVDVGVHQTCAISPWLFNVFMDGTLHEMKVDWSNCGVLLNHDGTK